MKNRLPFVLLALLTASILVFSACAPAQTQTPVPPPTQASVPVSTPAAVPTQHTLPNITLEKGDFYFSLDGLESFIFSRNPTGKTQTDFDTVLSWAHQSGSRLIRVHLTHGWWGDSWITQAGTVNEAWAKKWDGFFDQAQAEGIYILPVFAVWADWNAGAPDYGSAFWQYNPLNTDNGGPVSAPGELFQTGSPAQVMWLAWVESLVKRWASRENIAGWEAFSELNLASGAQGGLAEPAGAEFARKTYQTIRAADPLARPITTSLADTYSQSDPWAAFYHLDVNDFIEVHPYTGSLDRELISIVARERAAYHKPVLIGESGLSAGPASEANNLTTAQNAAIGICHAIWAGIVSGAMDGRALWHEDGYAIYTLDHPAAFDFMSAYAQSEKPAAKFVDGQDFTGYRPLPVSFPQPSLVWGAAVGSETSAIGWFRDAACEPPDWNLLPVVSGQSVTIAVSGASAEWKVVFYDTRTGEPRGPAAIVENQGGKVTVALPDFTDDIAFKMTARGGTAQFPGPAPDTDSIAGQWTGTISNTQGTFSSPLSLEIQSGCLPGSVCGKFTAPEITCAGQLYLDRIEGATFIFIEQNVTGAASCTSGGVEFLELQTDGSLAYRFTYAPGDIPASTGILKHP